MHDRSIRIGETHSYDRIRQGSLSSSKIVVKDSLADEGDNVGLDASRPDESQLDSARRVKDL